MSKLKVKTKGGSSPQGKPRVYFSCHPDDLDRYLEVLADDIFETQNCAIYYESDPETEADLEELTGQLADMQLFVVVLTTNFLTRASRARDLEYSLAHKLHTPILPIAMEPGLDSIFPEIMNRIGDGFGDIQFLDRTLQNAAEIPYKEKLKARLGATLVGDELAKRVRAAFDAYIFLSYRKKDRSLTKELMSLIHRIPYCRDIAIWYDEFLIPGEGWSDAIANAMAKSALVVLAVTPNLTEPGNFIVEHEYPDAVKNKKEIIPAELLPTDTETLRRLFPGIPDTVDGTNADAMSAALQLELQKLALAGNDEDLEHNFLIGLAYLGGIDVERDPERALELIKGAASKGLPEAIEKLAAMYHDGDGTARNYEESIFWFEKLLNIRKRAYKRNETLTAGKELIFAVWNLADTLGDARKLDEAKSAYEQMERYCNLVYEKYPTLSIHKLLGYCYQCLAFITTFSEESKGYSLKRLEILKELAAARKTEESFRDLADCYKDLGVIAETLEEFTEAKEYGLRSLEINKKLATATGSVKSRLNLGISYIRLGSIAKSQGNWDESKKYYLKALEINKKLVAETGSILSRLELLNTYEILRDFAQSQGNLAEVEEYCRKELEIREELAAETNSESSRWDLSNSYEELGETVMACGNLDKAQEYYQKSLNIREEIRLDELNKEKSEFLRIENEEFCQSLDICYVKLGEIMQSREEFTKAEEYYQKSLNICKKLAAETDTETATTYLVLSYQRLADIAHTRENLAEVEEYYRKELEIYKELAAETNSERSRWFLSDGYEQLGEIVMARGNLDEAQEYFQKCTEIILEIRLDKLNEEIESEIKSEDLCQDICSSYEKLGDIMQSRGEFTRAQEYFQKSLNIRKELAAKTRA